MNSPREEAEIIIEVLFDEYGSIGVSSSSLPPIQEGKEAIEWLKKKKLSYREYDWARYFIKFKTLELLEQKFPGRFKLYNSENKRQLMKGEYCWDIIIKTSNLNNNNVILWDTEVMDEFLKQHDGLGFILVIVYTEDNIDEGEPSKYTRKRVVRGKTSSIRNKDFFIIYTISFYFSEEVLQTGFDEGWVDSSFQLIRRNLDGKARKPKYSIDITRIPIKHGSFLSRNFNHDPNGFELFF